MHLAKWLPITKQINSKLCGMASSILPNPPKVLSLIIFSPLKFLLQAMLVWIPRLLLLSLSLHLGSIYWDPIISLEPYQDGGGKMANDNMGSVSWSPQGSEASFLSFPQHSIRHIFVQSLNMRMNEKSARLRAWQGGANPSWFLAPWELTN